MPEIILTPHQQEKYDEVFRLLRQGENRILLLGSAGVGKTVLASKIVADAIRDRTINNHYNNGHVFVNAPTNKALSVLQSKIQANVDFKTIHSACKLTMYKDFKTGQATFIKQKYAKDDLYPTCKISIIDEVSMLNSAFIGGTEEMKAKGFPGYLDNYNFPIIFIGDDKQLNPVGEEFSPVFHQGYPEVVLTEIIRQGAGNPIIDLSRDIDMIFFKQPSLVNGKGYTYDDNKEQMIDDLAEVNGTDEMKYLAWTNDEIDAMNKYVRERRYGNPAKLEKDETIVFNSPYGNFFTNQETKVEQLDIITTSIKIPTHNTRYDREGLPMGNTDSLKVKYYRVNDSFNVLHEDSEVVFKSVFNDVTRMCKSYGWSWGGKFYLEELYANIKYNHAITVHKSQGSTYKTTIINIGNIMFNKKAEERQRMLYTAITRASDLVILNNVK